MASPGEGVAARPLLAFPPPSVDGIPPADTRPTFRPVRRPSAGRQGVRLTPQFDALREALEAERAALTEATTAPDPELVAVFDLAGGVDQFLRAAAGVPGLEFLSDVQEESTPADEDFYYEADGEVSDDLVPQSLYMVMTNAEAVGQLVSLFERWQQDESVTFERGLNPLKQVFGLLRNIRRWGPEDRIRETGLLEQWREDVAVVGAQGTSRVEIELWYRREAADRAAAQRLVSDVVTSLGGAVISATELAPIAYHALLADIPMSAVDRVVQAGPDAIELLTTETVMMVSPSKPMVFRTPEPTEGIGDRFDGRTPTGLPRIALLDGLPLANHAALQGRLVIDDPDDFAANYQADQQCHGSTMASLIAHGDLSSPGPAIGQPIYVRPLLRPHPAFPRTEIAPTEQLLVDLVHRAFRRLFEGDGSVPPQAPSIRIVNFSIGDPTRTFVRRLSPLARLIDWLAWQYNLVIVVSAGNHDPGIELPGDALSDEDQSAGAVVKALRSRARHRRLLSPAEAVNALTVGALHEDEAATELPDTVRDVLPRGLPASYSALGFGFRRSVKPDMLLPGGRQVFVAPAALSAETTELQPASTLVTGPGIAGAAPGLAGELDAVSFTCGTSNAAAFATRWANAVFDLLETLKAPADEFPFPDAQYHPVLARTLLIHATSWIDVRGEMMRLLGLSSQEARRELTRLMGYGPLRPERLATAEGHRVLLVGAGTIGKDKRHAFRLPLPDALSATREWRRLTITLAWLSPVNVRAQKYRMARLRFSDPRDQLGVAPVEADHNAVLKGTVQHQVFEGTDVVAFVSGSDLVIDVDCRVDAGPLPSPVRYGLAASLEVAAATRIEVHQQVRERLRQAVRVQARARIAAT